MTAGWGTCKHDAARHARALEQQHFHLPSCRLLTPTLTLARLRLWRQRQRQRQGCFPNGPVPLRDVGGVCGGLAGQLAVEHQVLRWGRVAMGLDKFMIHLQVCLEPGVGEWGSQQ